MNVHNGYFKYNGLAYITDEQANQLDGVTVQKNDVLLNITGASVARTCVVPSGVLPARVNQHVSIIRCNPSRLNHIFANKVLTTESYQQLLISIGEAAGMSRQAITKAQIENLLMILPPIEMQTGFADFSEGMVETIASHQQALDEALKKRDAVLLKYL
jgi:type I restriction enzyme S subunit